MSKNTGFDLLGAFACFAKGLGKILAAWVVATILLSLIFVFYYIRPVHIDNARGDTDYVWPSYSYWVTLTEGVSVGHFDSLGFNNASVINNPDVLVLGSSHMEATNVMQNEVAPYILGKALKGIYTVYNKGISGHNFYKTCQYLSANLEMYERAPKYVVIESSVVAVDKKNIDEILSKKVKHTQSYSSGIIGTMQKVPFFRLLYMQTAGGLLKLFIPSKAKKPSDSQISAFFDKTPYYELFKYLRSVEDKFGTEIIIAYHPTGKIQKDGTILFKPLEKKDLLKKVADENGITFVDLTDDFEKMYYLEHHVAHGFITGKLESGHLNKYGHAAMASALYKTIVNMDKEARNAND